MSTWQKIIAWIKRPHGWQLAAHYVFAALVIAGASVAAALGWNTRWEIVAYALFAVAAISLGYTVYTVVYFVPKIRNGVKAWAQKYEFTQKMLAQYGFRTIVLTIGSLVISTLYALFNGAIAVLNVSVWYAALASYYILLASMRGGIVFHHRKARKAENETDEQTKERALKTYRTCGILLIFLPICLSGAVVQMVISQKAYTYAGLMIYAAAAYTFYKITMSIVNLIKARRSDDPTVRAVRNINFADALVSVLALQTAMFHAFSPESNLGYANAVMGGVVCALTVIMGVYMAVNGNLHLKHGKAMEPARSDEADARPEQGEQENE